MRWDTRSRQKYKLEREKWMEHSERKPGKAASVGKSQFDCIRESNSVGRKWQILSLNFSHSSTAGCITKWNFSNDKWDFMKVLLYFSTFPVSPVRLNSSTLSSSSSFFASHVFRTLRLSPSSVNKGSIATHFVWLNKCAIPLGKSTKYQPECISILHIVSTSSGRPALYY